MRTMRAFVIVFAVLALLVRPGGVASGWAQILPSAATPAPASPSAAPPASGSSAFVAVAIILVGLLIVLGLAVKFFDLRRRREADAVHLQAQISDALLRDPGVVRLAYHSDRACPAVERLASEDRCFRSSAVA